MALTARPQATAGSTTGGWLAPAGLLLLGMLPVVAGALRLGQLSGMSDLMPPNPRFAAAPLPVVIHIVSAIVFATLGPLQFVAVFRRRWPVWHRVAGRLLVVCGLLVALTGVWMTLFYERPDGSGDLLYASRLVFGVATPRQVWFGWPRIIRRRRLRRRLPVLARPGVALSAPPSGLVTSASLCAVAFHWARKSGPSPALRATSPRGAR
jgi:hypothetical protein